MHPKTNHKIHTVLHRATHQDSNYVLYTDLHTKNKVTYNTKYPNWQKQVETQNFVFKKKIIISSKYSLGKRISLFEK